MDRPTQAAPRFGIEEEYLLLDAATGTPRDAVDDLIAAVPALRAEHEFFACQLETATPVCSTALEAHDTLQKFRIEVSAAARDRGLVLAGTGLPPVGSAERGTVTGSPRYREIAGAVRGSVARYYSTGAHVHIEVPSRDSGVRAMSRFARWSPVLTALTANSPIQFGEETGFASSRYLQTQQWATSGYPPDFEDAADYERVVDGLVRGGALVDAALVNWSIRLSERFPTIELRTADAQLRAEDTVAFAMLFRALIAGSLREGESVTEPLQPDVLRGAHWRAARDGLAGDLFDPRLVDVRPAFDLVDEMLAAAMPDLESAGDTDLVVSWIERRRADLGPANLQRRAWESDGVPGLLRLYREGSELTR